MQFAAGIGTTAAVTVRHRQHGAYVNQVSTRTASVSKTARGQLTDGELAALAAFRAALRKFLVFSEQAAAAQGVTMQWYQALLVIKTFDSDAPITVGELGNQLMIRPHSAAELVSRLEAAHLVKRKGDPADRRRWHLLITASGDRCLVELAAAHLERLQEFHDAFLKPFKVKK